jgi:hypothetical protein
MQVEFATLPSVSFEERRHLPQESAIYFVTDPGGAVLYIGKSVDIRQRWATHHLLPRLKPMSGLRIAWLVPDQARSLVSIESDLIRDLDPPLNVVGAPTTKRLPRLADVAVGLMLRLPADLNADLKAWAKEDGRSLSNLIVHLLKRAVMSRPSPDTTPSPPA